MSKYKNKEYKYKDIFISLILNAFYKKVLKQHIKLVVTNNVNTVLFKQTFL